MTPITAAMAMPVVIADISIKSRTFASASGGSSGGAAERPARGLAPHPAEPPAALSRSRLKVLIEQGAVALDGQTIRDPSHRVNSGAAIVVDVPPAEPA